MDYSSYIRLDIDGPVARLSIDRADKRNALDQSMWETIPHRITQAMENPDVRIMLLGSATPGLFCAGADIGEFARKSQDADWRSRNQAAISNTQLAIARAEKPVIAVIDGDCIGGGCGLALAADIRIASPRARLGVTPSKLGLVYPLHDTKLLVDLVGPSKAKRILFTGQLYSAAQALDMGLVDEVADDAEAAADQLVQQMLATSPFTQRMTKKVVQRILSGQSEEDAFSTALFDSAFTGPDFAEGVDAFMSKRKPEFRG